MRWYEVMHYRLLRFGFKVVSLQLTNICGGPVCCRLCARLCITGTFVRRHTYIHRNTWSGLHGIAFSFIFQIQKASHWKPSAIVLWILQNFRQGNVPSRNCTCLLTTVFPGLIGNQKYTAFCIPCFLINGPPSPKINVRWY